VRDGDDCIRPTDCGCQIKDGPYYEKGLWASAMCWELLISLSCDATHLQTHVPNGFMRKTRLSPRLFRPDDSNFSRRRATLHDWQLHEGMWLRWEESADLPNDVMSRWWKMRKGCIRRAGMRENRWVTSWLCLTGGEHAVLQYLRCDKNIALQLRMCKKWKFGIVNQSLNLNFASYKMSKS